MAPQQLMTNPPPGLYEMRSRFDGKKGVLIAMKTETLDKNANPGPGSYQPKVTMTKTSILFGSSKRGGEPGSVKIRDQQTLKTTGSEKRIGIDSNPGPGSYQLKGALMSPQYSMAGKPPRPRDIEVPGPGSYNNEKFMNTIKTNKSIPFGFE